MNNYRKQIEIDQFDFTLMRIAVRN